MTTGLCLIWTLLASSPSYKMLLSDNVHNILRSLCPINEMLHREDGLSLEITLRVVILEFSHNEKKYKIKEQFHKVIQKI